MPAAPFGNLQLRRLVRMMDVVFALIIWRLFMLLPRPKDGENNWESVSAMLISEWLAFAVVILGFVIVIVYWNQSNTLLGHLARTDKWHTTITIFQLMFLLLFLYSIATGLRFEGQHGARVFESISAALVGITSYLSWIYAMRKDLLNPEFPEQAARTIRSRNLAEPITALITIPFAFVGPYLWEASWFFYPLIRGWLQRGRTETNG